MTAAEQTIAEELAVNAQLVRRSTVQVRTGRGAGSGVIWQSDGLIVTNAHVARGSHATVEMWDGETFEAEVTAREERRDLAALVANASGLPAAMVADSDALRVGQLVVAVGNPLGLSGALTTGIIHAIAPTPGRGQGAWVQADIHLAPGNSGGPLADVEGRVLGINSMVSGGLGLAVPSNAVKRFLGQREGRLQLGLTMQPVLVPSGNGRTALHGLLVLEVVPGSPADVAGLTLGDILVGVEGERFEDARDLLDALHVIASNRSLRVQILRGGKPGERDIPLPPATKDETKREGVGEAA